MKLLPVLPPLGLGSGNVSVCVCVCSVMWTVTRQALLSMEFSR